MSTSLATLIVKLTCIKPYAWFLPNVIGRRKFWHRLYDRAGSALLAARNAK